MKINNHIKDGRLEIYIKPNKQKNNIILNEKVTIELNAIPEDGKANHELLKYLKKLTKKQWRIVSGLKSRKKILELI